MLNCFTCASSAPSVGSLVKAPQFTRCHSTRALHNPHQVNTSLALGQMAINDHAIFLEFLILCTRKAVNVRLDADVLDIIGCALRVQGRGEHGVCAAQR